MSTRHNFTKQVPLNQKAVTEPLTLTVQDGVHYNPATNEYEVWLAGEIVNFATFEGTANFQYTEALRLRREHVTRNTLNLTENRIVILEAHNV